jgi:hypothetical protein
VDHRRSVSTTPYLVCSSEWSALDLDQPFTQSIKRSSRGPSCGYLPMRGAFLTGSSIFSPERWLASEGAFLLYFPDLIGSRVRLYVCWKPGAVLAQGQPLGCCMAVPGMLHLWDGRCWCFLTPWGIVEGSGSLFYLARLMARVEGTGGRLSAVGLLVDNQAISVVWVYACLVVGTSQWVDTPLGWKRPRDYPRTKWPCQLHRDSGNQYRCNRRWLRTDHCEGGTRRLIQTT